MRCARSSTWRAARGPSPSPPSRSKRQSIPHGFLQAILADLRRAQIALSQRGQSGGGGSPATPKRDGCSNAIRAVDGPLVSVDGQRPEAVSYNESAEAGLEDAWIAARSSLREVFEQVETSRLAAGALRPTTYAGAPTTRTPGSPHSPGGSPGAAGSPR